MEVPNQNPAPTPSPAPTPTPNQGGPTPPQPTPTGDDRRFSQQEVDRIVGERLARDRKERDTAAEEERRRKEMTEFERLKAEKADVEKQAQATLAMANDRLVKAEVMLVSARLGIVDPELAYLAMDRTGVKVTDDGKVEGVEASLDALLKAKPVLRGVTPTKPSVGNPGGNPGPQQDLDMVAAAQALARQRNEKGKKPTGGFDPWGTK